MENGGSPAAGPGRARQRQRTHAALLAAAARLMARGQTPTVAEVADEALVSRRTAYRYFTHAEQLLIDAALEAARTTVLEAITSTDPYERVDQLVRTLHTSTVDNEPLLRALMRLTLDRPADSDGPRRGYRRVHWIEEALTPLRPQLTDHAWQRLVAALSLTIGIEAQLVLRDVVGLQHHAIGDVERWAARALLRTALDEAADTHQRGGVGERSMGESDRG
ncbi:TetR/AcrR family transcriptional regulator [Streptomyces sp. BR1]|uniref:TetR/AcrR family transcriptional regulator n=1 Tax=Streptomyces sp. BR1 TaxID=1592323 RepID=UPI00402B60C4